MNPANWSFTDIPDLKINLDYGYGAGVLLPGPPSGSNKVLLIGGANEVADTSTATTEQFDAANPSAGWSFKAPLPESRRNVNGVILPDGKILAVGGNTTGASDGYRFESRELRPGDQHLDAARRPGRGPRVPLHRDPPARRARAVGRRRHGGRRGLDQRRRRGLLAPVPLQGRAAGDHLGADERGLQRALHHRHRATR